MDYPRFPLSEWNLGKFPDSYGVSKLESQDKFRTWSMSISVQPKVMKQHKDSLRLVHYKFTERRRQCEIQIQQLLKKRTILQSDIPVDGDNVELVVFSRVAPVSWMRFRLLWKREFDVVSFTIVLTICRLATCASAISANFESMTTNSSMLGLVTNHSRYSCSEGSILFCRRFLSHTGI